MADLGNSRISKLDGRFWPIVKALRALGIDVPEDARDDEAVVFVWKPETTL